MNEHELRIIKINLVRFGSFSFQVAWIHRQIY